MSSEELAASSYYTGDNDEVGSDTAASGTLHESMPSWNNNQQMRIWELNDTSTRYDRMTALPSDDDMAIMFFGWFGISAIVSTITVMVFVGVVSNKEARRNPFNMYLIFLMIPDLTLSLPCFITCLINGIVGHFATKFLCQAQSFYATFGISANSWLNAVVCYQLYVMLLATRQCVPYELPKLSTVVKHASCVYLWSGFVSSMGLWSSIPALSEHQPSHWLPHQTIVAHGVACMPMNYDKTSTVFFYLVFFPALIGIPMIYVAYVAYQIHKHHLLPQSGNRRLLSVYFLRLAAAFFTMWLPGILLFFIVGPLVNPWLFWVGGSFFHMQGGFSAAVSMLKPDVYKAVYDYWTCRNIVNTLPTITGNQSSSGGGGRNIMLQGMKLQVAVGIDDQKMSPPSLSCKPIKEANDNSKLQTSDQQSRGQIRSVMAHSSNSCELRLLAPPVDGGCGEGISSLPITTGTNTTPSVVASENDDNSVCDANTTATPTGQSIRERNVLRQMEVATGPTLADHSDFESDGIQSSHPSLPRNQNHAMQATTTNANAHTNQDGTSVNPMSPVQQVLETALNLIRESLSSEENNTTTSSQSVSSQRSSLLQNISDALTTTRDQILSAQQQQPTPSPERPQEQHRQHSGTTNYVGRLPPLPRSAVSGMNFPTITSSTPGCHPLPATSTPSLVLPPVSPDLPPLPWMVPSGEESTFDRVLRVLDEVLSIVDSEIESITSEGVSNTTRSPRSVQSNLEATLEDTLDAVNNMLSPSSSSRHRQSRNVRQHNNNTSPPTSQAPTNTIPVTTTPWVPSVIGGGNRRAADVSMLSSTIAADSTIEEDDHDEEEAPPGQ